uniref:Uncharacterized protein n=1 Tax=Amphimedon queenslandica TaxID=400682 RepID=A0A1X7U2U4_AMPQE
MGVLTQVIRLYKNIPTIELEYTVGPIQIKCIIHCKYMYISPQKKAPYGIRDGLGKEIISHFTTDLKTDSTFYHVLILMGEVCRKEYLYYRRNYHLTWTYNKTEPIAGTTIQCSLFHLDRSRHGGGVAIYAKSCLQPSVFQLPPQLLALVSALNAFMCPLLIDLPPQLLLQIVTQPTHYSHSGSPSIIDLVFVPRSAHGSAIVTPPLGSPDHCTIISLSFSFKPPPSHHQFHRKVWLYHKAEFNAINDSYNAIL